MKKLFKPYGVAFKIGMILLASCSIFVVVVWVFYTQWYEQHTQQFKTQAANLWAITFALGFLLIIVGSPTTPSKK
jgi:hypothetical protein